MNNKEKQKSKNLKEGKSSSLDEDISSIKEILLDIVEDPNLIIEKILISLFNEMIINKDEIEENFILFYQKKIKDLCQKHQKKNITLLLFLNISNIIQRYRRIILETPNITEYRQNFSTKNDLRSFSHEEKHSKKYLYFDISDRKNKLYSPPKKVRNFDYISVMKNLFNKLLGIKHCLKRAVPIIEKIFEYPLTDFEDCSVQECTMENFLRIIIHDNFIWNEIIKNRRGELKILVQQLLEDFDKDCFYINNNDNNIDYFNKFTKKTLKVQNAQSSFDTRTPDDAFKISPIYYDDEHEKLFNKESDFNNEETVDNIIQNKNNNLSNINMIKLNSRDFINNKFDINKAIFTNETINEINKINTINNLAKENLNLNLQKNFSFPGNTIKVPNLPHINLSNIPPQKPDKPDSESNSNNKFNKKRFHKKVENNNIKNKKSEEIKNKKEEKSEIPNDLDDLVKYIKDDNNQNKKKKKNRKKTKKRNKNAGGENSNENKKEQNENKDDDNFIDDEKDIQIFKDDLIKDSINRFKIHKIKFKYRPKYLKKISKFEN